MALTATATPRVQSEIMAGLGLRSPLVAKTSFNRWNLHYSASHLGQKPPLAFTFEHSSGTSQYWHAALCQNLVVSKPPVLLLTLEHVVHDRGETSRWGVAYFVIVL